jgi:hypothetical protein
MLDYRRKLYSIPLARIQAALYASSVVGRIPDVLDAEENLNKER